MSMLKQLFPLMPVLIVSLTAIIVMMMIAVKRHHGSVATVTVIGLNAALISIFVRGYLLCVEAGVWSQAHSFSDRLFLLAKGSTFPQPVTHMFTVDGFAIFFMWLVVLTALGCVTVSYAYLSKWRNNKEETYLLLLIAVVGAMLMGASNNLASVFISLELLSVPLYGLLGYTHDRKKSLEAALKYTLLSAAASACFLLGMAYIFAFTGSLQLGTIAQQIMQNASQAYVLVGVALIIAASAFKLSLVPFHAWTADVYQGSPSPNSTFMATVSKVAAFALFMRLILSSGLLINEVFREIVTVMGVLSIIIGNLLAINQSNLKRILAYSSISHFGYAVIAFICLGGASTNTVSIYLLTYVVTTLGAFAAVSLMSSPYNDGEEAENLADYRGLFWRRPVLTAALTIMMLSLAGIPGTAGFIGKFVVILATVQTKSWWLTAAIILGSALGLYFYLRVMIVLYMRAPSSPKFMSDRSWGSETGAIIVFLMTMFVLLLGLYPQPMLSWAQFSQIQLF